MSKRTTSSARDPQQMQMLIIGGGVTAALIAAIAAIFIITSGASVDACDADDESCYSEYLSAEQGFTEQNFAKIGSDDAPIYIAEFADFACPHCRDYHPTVKRLVGEFAPEGEAQFWYVPLDGTGGANSRTAYQAAYCAGEQNAFWQFHEEIFELQESEGSNAFERDELLDIAGDMGLDTGEMESCMNNSRSRIAIPQARQLATELGVTATPTVAISLDGGETWRVMPSRDYNALAAEIARANS
jgi:predicted DsbA family dithiol-disulfide isomerase